MPKVKVSFHVTDGKKPARDRGPAQVFNLRSPIPLNIPPGAEVRLDLAVSCSHPVHVFQARGLKARGLELVDGVWACHDADENIVLKIKNVSKETALVDEGETIARCAVLDNSNVIVEE